MRKIRQSIVPVIVLLVLAIGLVSTSGEPESQVQSLQQAAHQSYTDKRYTEAVALYQELLQVAPQGDHRAHAIRMLGMINDFNLFNLDAALTWYGQYLKEFAAADRMTTTIRWRLDLIRNLGEHREAYVAFQKVKLLDQNTPQRLKALATLMETYPDYDKKYEVAEALAWEYRHARQYGKSYGMFKVAAMGNPTIPADKKGEQLAEPRRTWKRSVYAKVCWLFILIVVVCTILLQPWRQVDREQVKHIAPLFAAWLLIMVAGVVLYIVKVRHYTENPFTIPDVVVLLTAGLVVLGWAFMFGNAPLWKTGSQILVLVPPLAAILLSLAVFYLYLYHQKEWIMIMYDFLEQYGEVFYWLGKK
jgi:tetratricopeptide (TPR) repeat protein